MEKQLNIITLGDAGVGKTSIINGIESGAFRESCAVTVSVGCFFVGGKYEKKNLIMNLTFRDAAGQEMFETLPQRCVRGCHVVLLVFAGVGTLNELKGGWLGCCKGNADVGDSRFVLVGDESGLFGDNRGEMLNEGRGFAGGIGARFVTCSAESADDVGDLERFVIAEAKRFIDDEEKYNNVLKKNKTFNLKKNKNNNINKETSECKC